MLSENINIGISMSAVLYYGKKIFDGYKKRKSFNQMIDDICFFGASLTAFIMLSLYQISKYYKNLKQIIVIYELPMICICFGSFWIGGIFINYNYYKRLKKEKSSQKLYIKFYISILLEIIAVTYIIVAFYS